MARVEWGWEVKWRSGWCLSRSVRGVSLHPLSSSPPPPRPTAARQCQLQSCNAFQLWEGGGIVGFLEQCR